MIKCLDKYQKAYIVRLYNLKKHNIKGISEAYHVSPRTIKRVLVEAGVATTNERSAGEDYQIAHLVKSYGLDLHSLNKVLKAMYEMSA